MFRRVFQTLATVVPCLLASVLVADDDLFVVFESGNGSTIQVEVLHPGILMSIEIENDEVDIEAFSIDGDLQQDESVDFDEDYIELQVLGSDRADDISLHFKEAIDEVSLFVQIDAAGGDDQVVMTSDESQLQSSTHITLMGRDGDDTLINDSDLPCSMVGGLGRDSLEGGLGFDALLGEECPNLFASEDLQLILDGEDDLLTDAGGGVIFVQVALPVIDSTSFVYETTTINSPLLRNTNVRLVTNTRIPQIKKAAPLTRLTRKAVAVETTYKWELAESNVMLSPIDAWVSMYTFFAEPVGTVETGGQSNVVVAVIGSSEETNWLSDAPELDSVVTSL